MAPLKSLNIGLSLVFILLICSVTSANDAPDISSLDGNAFLMVVNRDADHPEVQFPDEELDENDYEVSQDNVIYLVSFSKEGNKINIEPGGISGRMVQDGDEEIEYLLDQGLFAGGRFIVWIHNWTTHIPTLNNILEAELTFYGSGVPIIKSERGYLLQLPKNIQGRRLPGPSRR